MIVSDKSALLCLLAAVSLWPSAALAQTRPEAGASAAQLERFRHAQALAVQNLHTFDVLDFDVFSNQKWSRLSESHAPDIVVHWPDGHVEKGIAKHIQSLKWMFTFAPDTSVKEHPVRIAQGGEWTAVHGFVQGTFTKPMTMPDGKVVLPTGRHFHLPMATIGHWVNGKMDEEYLFWDTGAWFGQMGIKS